MDYTEATLEAERFGLLNRVPKEEVVSWLLGEQLGKIDPDWDEEA